MPAVSRRPLPRLKNPVPTDMSEAAKAMRQRIESARKERLGEILARIRVILTPTYAQAYADTFEQWTPWAALAALTPDTLVYAEKLRDHLSRQVGVRIAAEHWLPVEFVRVLNLLDDLVWIADRSHEPENWPDRRRAQGRE